MNASDNLPLAEAKRIAESIVGTVSWNGAEAAWFAARSPIPPDNRTPASFLHAIYEPGERVVVFDVFESQGQAVWTCQTPPFNADELDSFTTGRRCGVWYLCNPVSGEFA